MYIVSTKTIDCVALRRDSKRASFRGSNCLNFRAKYQCDCARLWAHAKQACFPALAQIKLCMAVLMLFNVHVCSRELIGQSSNYQMPTFMTR